MARPGPGTITFFVLTQAAPGPGPPGHRLARLVALGFSENFTRSVDWAGTGSESCRSGSGPRSQSSPLRHPDTTVILILQPVLRSSLCRPPSHILGMDLMTKIIQWPDRQSLVQASLQTGQALNGSENKRERNYIMVICSYHSTMVFFHNSKHNSNFRPYPFCACKTWLESLWNFASKKYTTIKTIYPGTALKSLACHVRASHVCHGCWGPCHVRGWSLIADTPSPGSWEWEKLHTGARPGCPVKQEF